MVVDLYCGGVVVITVDDGFSFAAAKATKYEHATTPRHRGLSFARSCSSLASFTQQHLDGMAGAE